MSHIAERSDGEVTDTAWRKGLATKFNSDGRLKELRRISAHLDPRGMQP